MKFKRVGVATGAMLTGVALFSMLTFGSIKAEPLTDRQRMREEVFYPYYNAIQPNKIVIEVSEKTKEWLKQNGFEKENIQNMSKDSKKTIASKLAILVSAQKKLPVDKIVQTYFDELKTKPRGQVSPEDFFNLDAVLCGERAAFLKAALRELEIDGSEGMHVNLFVLKSYVEGENVDNHIFLVLRDGNNKLILDPMEGIVETSFSRYKERYRESDPSLKDSTSKVLPLIKFMPEYARYLKDLESEKKMENDFHQQEVLE